MNMNNNKTIDVLNTLVTINNDRIEGYDTAIRETNEADLRHMFEKFMRTSEACRQELADEIKKLGGTPEEGTKTSGKFFRAWMDVKAALSANDRKTVLNSCETGEDFAVNTYENVLKKDLSVLTTEQISMINSQYRKIKEDHDKVKSMRDIVISSMLSPNLLFYVSAHSNPVPALLLYPAADLSIEGDPADCRNLQCSHYEMAYCR